MPDVNMSLRTLLDVVRISKFKMADTKPEVEMLNGEIANRFQRYTHICNHARHSTWIWNCRQKFKMAATEIRSGNNVE